MSTNPTSTTPLPDGSTVPTGATAPDRSTRRPWRRRPVVIASVLVALVGAAWLAFGFFGFQTLFIDDEVSESGPVFASGAGDPTSADPEPADAELTDPEPAGDPEPAEAPVVRTLVTGSFVDRSHPTSGTASVLNDGSEQRFLRFEAFRTDNGPDLKVYLTASGPDAPTGEIDDDFVSLGVLKGNVGEQNYEIPAGVDLDRYSTVVIWCERFSVVFGAAALS